MELAAFTASTRNAPLGSISVFRNLMTEVQLRSHKGVTRSVIRLALEAETEYQKIVGSDSRPPAEPDFKVMTLQQAQSLILRKPLHRRAPPVLSPSYLSHSPPRRPPRVPAALDHRGRPQNIHRAPRSKRLARGGIKPMRKRFNEATKALRNSPCLHRIYHFTDYPSARQFLTAIVAAIPVQPSTPWPAPKCGCHLRSAR
ncbi:hypothetical protein B0H17DRAFT_636532 [Mycena rosella]|uniref:Uncharacterized protein n=1 Tax=Mycena rosella TaxID=1033263 RepID=A0AAD7DDX7_MYCRO|nr:hypothetical protein B0H17DRAFT_636532 [Mycena rosella]